MKATYLVTGGAGFIGRHVCDELLKAGYGVRVLDALIEQVHGPDAAVQARSADVEFIDGDIRDPETVRRAIAGVAGVFHLAAEVGVGQSMYEITRYVGTNDLGTAVLIQELIDQPVERVVVASSMSVYGEGLYVDRAAVPQLGVRRQAARLKSGLWDPVDTDGNPLTPVPTDETKTVDLASIYALTKYVQERSILIYGEAYGVDTVALRLFNVFGPGQALSNPYTGVLANFGARILNGHRPLIFEDGQQRRDFVHVRDVARAFRLAMEAPRAGGQVINIGSGRPYAIERVATLLAEAMGVSTITPQILQKARAGDVRHCFADPAKARELLGFAPNHSLEESIGEIAAWIRASSDAADRGEDARRQLEARGLVA